MKDLFKNCPINPMIEDARKGDYYPYFHPLESRPDIEVMMEGKKRIMLGSNNYLGLTVHPDVIEAAHKALEVYGTGCSGSRFMNGTLDMHLTLEAELAKFLRKEACVVFSTGYQANLGIISTIVGRHDYIICDKENHASIYDGCKQSFGKMLRFNHSDMDDLERCLKKIPETSGALIVTDGVFSMGGDICNLPEIVRLAKQYGARIMIDDAHGLGVLGEGGRGTASHFGLEDQVDLYMGTFSKSLASLGGYLVGSYEVCEFVRHNSRAFIFSASNPPASTAAALAALRVLEQNPDLPLKLMDNVRYLRDGLIARGVPIKASETPILPIYTYDLMTTMFTTKALYDAGIYVNPAIPPATPPGECLLRCSLMASHTKEVLDNAIEIIAEVMDAIKGRGDELKAMAEMLGVDMEGLAEMENAADENEF